MIKKKIIIVLFAICILLISFCVLNYKEYEKLKKTNTNLKDEIELKTKEIENTKEKETTLKSDYEKLEKEKKDIINKYKTWEEKNKKILKNLP